MGPDIKSQKPEGIEYRCGVLLLDLRSALYFYSGLAEGNSNLHLKRELTWFQWAIQLDVLGVAVVGDIV